MGLGQCEQCGKAFSGLTILTFHMNTHHLVALIEDPSVKSTDKQKLKCYVTQWRDTKIIIGCALFHQIYCTHLRLSASNYRMMSFVLSLLSRQS